MGKASEFIQMLERDKYTGEIIFYFLQGGLRDFSILVNKQNSREVNKLLNNFRKKQEALKVFDKNG